MGPKRQETLLLEGRSETDADYSNLHLGKLAVVNCRFERCDFSSARINDAGFGSGRGNSEYIECSFDGARIAWFSPGEARFVRCSFRDVKLDELFSYRGEWIGCTFSGVLKKGVFERSIRESDRRFTNRLVNEISGNDFRALEFRDIAFRSGVDLEDQLLPTTASYCYVPNAVSALFRTRTEIDAWKDDDLRREALSLVELLEMELRNGQQQLFLRRDSLYGPTADDRKLVDLILSLLEKNISDS